MLLINKNLTVKSNHRKEGTNTTYVTKIDWQACPEKINPNHTKFNLVSSNKKVQGSYKLF